MNKKTSVLLGLIFFVSFCLSIIIFEAISSEDFYVIPDPILPKLNSSNIDFSVNKIVWTSESCSITLDVIHSDQLYNLWKIQPFQDYGDNTFWIFETLVYNDDWRKTSVVTGTASGDQISFSLEGRFDSDSVLELTIYFSEGYLEFKPIMLKEYP